MTRLILLMTVSLLLVACGDRIEPGRTEDRPAPVSGLTTLVVEAVAAPARYALPGTLESADRGLLTARIPGQVAQIRVAKGQAVKAGDLLLTLKGETATSTLQSATSALSAATRRLAEAETGLKLAEANYARFVKLRAAGAVTPYEFDRIAAERDTASERLGAAQADVAASRAQRDSARTMAEQAAIRAPYAATVAGVLVDAGTTVMPGTPLLQLDRSGPLLVRVAIPESLATGHQLGDRFQVEIPTLAREVTGTLAELLPNADPGSRTIMAWLALPEDGSLKSGLYARVLLTEGPAATTLMVPAGAIVTRGQLTGVYVVRENILHYRLVRTGTVHGDQVEILSGLTAGEEIVARDPEKARNGAALER
jgi:RND family efflux transporter MFP subunit